MENNTEILNVPSRQELDNYRSLLKEATDQRIRLRFLEKDAERLGGINSPKAEAYRNAIKRNITSCCEIAAKVQIFINTIEDSRVRRIFTMYYIDGWSWQKIAFAIGSHSEATPRNMHSRYLERLYKKQDI